MKALVLLSLVLATLGGAPGAAAQNLAVHVTGNQLVDGGGNPIRLFGVDRSGSEYMCLSGGGIFDGPVDDTAIAAIKAWNTNVVRVPLNEDCWLGINIDPGNPDIGAPYRQAIVDFVSRLNAAGLYAILEVHLNAPGGNVAGEQQPMLDKDHGPAFWASVARTFKHDPAVIFDLYNEPHDISWKCWRSGCMVTTDLGRWRTAGMQSLVTAVRRAGAKQPIMLGGLGWASDLSQWLRYRPQDPQGQLVAAYHSYCGPPGTDTVAKCQAQLAATEAQWPAVVSTAMQAPVVTGEFGEYDCATTYVEPYMAFADQHGLSYLGWAWDTYGCGSFPSLISDYGGTPTAYGIGLKNRLAALGP